MIKNVEAISDLESFVNSLNHSELFKTNNEEIIYHYTSIDGLEGIISKKELWFSQILFLNDKKEFNYTLSLIEDLLDKSLDENEDEDTLFRQVLLSTINDKKDLLDIYVLSTSINSDSNLLWSNYASNDGYNVGFNYVNLLNSLNRNINQDVGIFQPYPIMYAPEKQEELILKELRRIYQIFKYCIKDKEILIHEFQHFIRFPLTNILVYSAFFKDESFESEEEFRIGLLVIKDQAEQKYQNFRKNNGVFTPFVSISFDNVEETKVIESITIGPKNNMDLSVLGLRVFIEYHGYKDSSEIEIKKSRIPYRY